MAKELIPGTFDGRQWIYGESSVMNISEEAAAQYDAALEPMEKKYQPSQDEFLYYEPFICRGGMTHRPAYFTNGASSDIINT